MPDREKIIRGLERCLVCNTSAITSAEGEKAYRDCEYTVALYCRQDKLLRDVLTLLKEQEAVEPKQVDLYGKEDWYGLVCICPDCKAEWMSDKVYTHFCPNCGKAVKWDA